jgi:hypothetical protein
MSGFTLPLRLALPCSFSHTGRGWWRGYPAFHGTTGVIIIIAFLELRYHNIAKRFFAKTGFQHVMLLSADGALEAAPAMGSADIILDLVRCSYQQSEALLFRASRGWRLEEKRNALRPVRQSQLWAAVVGSGLFSDMLVARPYSMAPASVLLGP